jgi:anti-sigma B factor antagonist
MIALALAKLLEGAGLNFEQRERDGIAIVDLDGRLVQGDQDLAFRQCMESIAGAGQRNVILNLIKLREIDNTGHGSLEFCIQKFRELGGRCVLLHLDAVHKQGIDISNDFETYEEEVDAVNSFFPDRKVPHYDILNFVAKLKTDEPEGQHESEVTKT